METRLHLTPPAAERIFLRRFLNVMFRVFSRIIALTIARRDTKTSLSCYAPFYIIMKYEQLQHFFGVWGFGSITDRKEERKEGVVYASLDIIVAYLGAGCKKGVFTDICSFHKVL